MSSIGDIFEIAEKELDRDSKRRNDQTIQLVSAILINRGLKSVADSIIDLSQTLGEVLKEKKKPIVKGR